MAVKLREWLDLKGWTLQEAADLTGYSLSYMSLVASGKRTLNPDAKVYVARRLGTRVGELFPVSREELPEAEPPE